MTGTEDAAPLIVAHRGASGFAPENTIAAIAEAIRQGADFVEVDLQLTKDGEVVLVHDATLARTTDAAAVFPDREPWRITDFTLDEIRDLDAGAWFDDQFAGERIPTLKEALEAMDGQIGMWLELKSPRMHPGLEKAVAEVLRTTPGGWLTEPGTCVATCFDDDSLERFAAEVDRAIPFGQLASTVPDDETLAAVARRATFYIPDCRALEPGELTRIRAAGLGAVFWTPNDAVTLASLIAEGAAAVITNYPGLAVEVAEGKQRRPEEGLVVEKLDGQVATIRNLGPDAIDVEGWFLRADPATRVWTGASEDKPAQNGSSGEVTGIIANGAKLDVDLALETDSIALHRPDGELVDVAGRVA